MPDILAMIAERGGLRAGVAKEVARASGRPDAEVYGAASFYHLLSRPEAKLRVCMGLSCQLQGARELLERAQAAGLPVEGSSCLAACDRPNAVLKEREVLTGVSAAEPVARWEDFGTDDVSTESHVANIGEPAVDLLSAQDLSAGAFFEAERLGPEAVIQAIEDSGLQGRGGAGFPAAFKWKSVRSQAETTRYVVLNADEGEPGTFKDREVLLRRPDRVVEGLAIAARAVGATDIYCYLRGEFQEPWRRLESAIERFGDLFEDLEFHLHAGHGAYICGEETALLEALEGRRGMPRLKPPFPTEHGLYGKPTLMHNVETIACVPEIVRQGGDWFRQLGRGEPGSKLYSVSGHVSSPGVLEAPLGATLDELVAACGGYEGSLQAFSPGGASSGFLPACHRDVPMDYKSLAALESMLGSAGVVVLNDTVDLAWAVRQQLRFFEVESCGQCAPCRIGTRFLREAVDRAIDAPEAAQHLRQAAEVAWEMNEGSICGLGQAAPLPLTSVLKNFPEVFASV